MINGAMHRNEKSHGYNDDDCISPVLLDHVSAILGERVVVTHELPSAPQVLKTISTTTTTTTTTTSTTTPDSDQFLCAGPWRGG